MHPNICIDIYYRYVCVFHAYTCILHFICMCENWSTLCVRAPVCDGDGSAVCARVGGLVLRARPKSRNREPCEPLPIGVDRVAASARRRSPRRRRSTRTSARGTPRVCRTWPMYAPPFRPGPLHRKAGCARPGCRCGAGPLCAAAALVRARVCADTWARARAGAHMCRYSCAYERRDMCTEGGAYMRVCDRVRTHLRRHM